MALFLRTEGSSFLTALGVGVKNEDYITGSVLIHYILRGSSWRPAGKFVTFAELAGPLFKHGSYSSSVLERPIIKRFQGAFRNYLRRRHLMAATRVEKPVWVRESDFRFASAYSPYSSFSMNGMRNLLREPPCCMISQPDSIDRI